MNCSIMHCSVNDGWSVWSGWSHCNVTCGGGIHNRTRNCDNPEPAFNGSYCIGVDTDSRPCNILECPVNGAWATWTSWDACSSTCGRGITRRTRTCDNPVPLFGGRNCTGPAGEQLNCSALECPVHGDWSVWSRWSTCNVACGGGIQKRTKNCDSPEPAFVESDCVGLREEQRDCNTFKCPVDGRWSSWMPWSICSVTCGSGFKTRKRSCNEPFPSWGGQLCSGESTEILHCDQPKCPVDGNWATWTPWEVCTTTCGAGITRRSRNCDSPMPLFGGSNCSGLTEELSDCFVIDCPVNGGWSMWSAWSHCNVTCDGGIRSRIRKCDSPEPAFNGTDCVGHDNDKWICNTFECPVDGGWGSWTIWSTCSVTCGSGFRTRKRSCDKPYPSWGGDYCDGESFEILGCDHPKCQVNGDFGGWNAWTECSSTCGPGIARRERYCDSPPPLYGGLDCSGLRKEESNCFLNECPVDGGWSVWSQWNKCNVTCGGGIHNRTKNCDSPEPAFNGSYCIGEETDSRPCNTLECPVDGNWATWLPWSDCSTTCGLGVMKRKRYCDSPAPLNGGSNCSGLPEKRHECSLMECPVDGGWSAWTNWNHCNATCGGGIQYKLRKCDSPVPTFNGSDCIGDFTGSQDCNTLGCPVDGDWSHWTRWSTCSEACGTGYQTRQRLCDAPFPAFNGDYCSGDHFEIKKCSDAFCSVDGYWSSWLQWALCNVTCGGGIRTRSRKCENPAPAHGGTECDGSEKETEDCATGSCPGNGGWSEWSDWSLYSVTCDGGYKLRSRQCDSPKPTDNGLFCNGDDFQNLTCNTGCCQDKQIQLNHGTWIPFPPLMSIGIAAGCILILVVFNVIGCCICRLTYGKTKDTSKSEQSASKTNMWPENQMDGDREDDGAGQITFEAFPYDFPGQNFPNIAFNSYLLDNEKTYDQIQETS